MGTGYLVVKVYADSIGQPLSNVSVTIVGNNITKTTTTDPSGHTDEIALECPEKTLSLQYQSEKKPYETYDLKIEKPGLEPVTIKGVQIYDTVLATQEVILKSEPGANSPEELITIPENSLWGNYPPKIVVTPQSQIPKYPKSGDVLPTPIVPEYVVVHDGLPTNSNVPNYYVLFSDYIKNVASGQIYSTWPPEAIKANIYAILSFTMNRIYSEWYPSKGYRYTITSSSQFDQSFVYGRTIYQPISLIVDSIFDEYISRTDQNIPFFAQYNNGVSVNNPGWLNQWESNDLANKGYSAVDILKYYYGNEILIRKADIIEGVPDSFPGYNLELGICSEEVQKMQAQLNFISSSYPAIPKISLLDGKYGETTKSAVESFQSIFSIPVTGIIDFQTWYRISYVYVGVLKMLQSRYVF